MKTSESVTAIYKALIEFHGSVGKVKKDSKNPHFKSTYASLPDILDAVTAPLTSAGLCVIQMPAGRSGLTTRLCHISGEWLEETYEMPPAQATPQGIGSAITYQRRYALCAVLSLNVDDDDGHAGSVQPATKQAAAKSAPPPPAATAEQLELIAEMLAMPIFNSYRKNALKKYPGLKGMTHERAEKMITGLESEINKAMEAQAETVDYEN